MGIIGKITEKPWENLSSEEDFSDEAEQESGREKTIALRFFLGIVTVVFFLFIITFLSRSQFSDFQALAGEPWQPFTNASQLWLNTLILLASSLCLHWSMRSANKNKVNSTLASLSLAGFFSFLFIVAQLQVWQQLIAQGFYVYSNPANSFYYLLTAIHGLHLLGGLFVLTMVLFRFWRGAKMEEINASLTLCTSYWHYLFVVWLVLFALLTSTAETFNRIAALCGF